MLVLVTPTGFSRPALTTCFDHLLWRLRLYLPEDIDSFPYGYQQIFLSY